MVNRLAAALIEGLFPQRCLLCAMHSHCEWPLCEECLQDMPANRPCCPRCALPMQTADRRTPAVCGHCLQTPPPFDRVLAPWLYGEYMAHLIHRWKYAREQRLTGLLAQLWLRQAPEICPVDLLVPVPLHWRRRYWRGFNQADLLAREMLRSCPKLATRVARPGLARRRRATTAQSGIGASARDDNLRGAFTVHRRCDNLAVAIIDDVLTTGATAAALACALSAAGATRVEVWCLARTPPPGG